MRVRTTRTEVTIETETVIAVSGGSSGVTFCPECAAARVMLTPFAAASVSGTNAREIYRRVVSGALHSVDAPNGQLLVCAVSLQKGLQT